MENNDSLREKIKIGNYTIKMFSILSFISLAMYFILDKCICINFFNMGMIGVIVSCFVVAFYERKIWKSILGIVLIVIGFVCSYKAAKIQVENSMYQMSKKPIIYLYPEETTKVNVSLGNPKLLTCTYPKYNERIGWNVIAEPSGNLKYANDGKNQNLYALYWEGKSASRKRIEDDGFIVKGKDTIELLEDKLKILGLNEREAEEFIVYWLPRMENNEYNYIRFETANEIENNMPLNITPKPDTTIRVMMDWCEISSEREAKALQEKIKEQKLETPERTGFVTVEWGGNKIK